MRILKCINHHKDTKEAGKSCFFFYENFVEYLINVFFCVIMQDENRVRNEKKTMCIRVGIYGYGNLGRGVELACRQNADMEVVGVFTRRDPSSVKTATGAPV